VKAVEEELVSRLAMALVLLLAPESGWVPACSWLLELA
jgi:hypothetical protein